MKSMCIKQRSSVDAQVLPTSFFSNIDNSHLRSGIWCPESQESRGCGFADGWY